MDYVLRLQALDGYQAKFDDVFSDRFKRVLCVHHTGKKGDNPHYHFCLTTDYKKDALRKYLKGHFDLATGNRHLSLKDWDGDKKACSYLFHEHTEELIVKGFTPDEINEFKIDNDIVQSKMVKAPTIVKLCVEHFKEKGRSVDKKEIFTHMIKLYRKNGEWIPNRFQADRLITKIRSDLAQTDAQEALFIQNLYNEYFPYA